MLPTLPIVGDAYIAAGGYDEMLRGQRAAGREVDGAAREARAGGRRARHGHVLDFGGGPDAIVRFAKRQRADLIVMGTHGHGVLARRCWAAWPSA